MSPLRTKVRQRAFEYRKYLGPSKLWLDDLEEVVRTVREFATEEQSRMQGEGQEDGKVRELLSPLYEVSLEAGKSQADEVADLLDAREKDLQNIRITLTRPFIVVALSPFHSHVSVLSSDEERRAVGLAEDIAQYIHDRRVKWLWPRDRALWLFVASVALIAAANAARGNPVTWALASLVAVVALATVWYVGLRRFGGVKVVPQWRREVRKIREQTLRELLIGTTAAIIGGAVGAIIGAILAGD